MLTLKALAIGLSVLVLVKHIPGVINVSAWRDTMKDILKSDETVLRLAGLVAMIMSFLILTSHMKIEKNWESVIPVIGWLMLAKGIILVWNPRSVSNMGLNFLKNNTLVALCNLAGLALGVGLGYLGLFIY